MAEQPTKTLGASHSGKLRIILSAIRHADVVLVLKDCELVEQRTRDELMANGVLDAELYTPQNSEVVEKTRNEPARD